MKYGFYIFHINTNTISLTSISNKRLRSVSTKTVKQKKLTFIYDRKKWSHNRYWPLVTKYIAHILNGSLKSLRRLAYLRRCFPTTNHKSASWNFSETESCSFPRTSLWDADVVARYWFFFLFLDHVNLVLDKCDMYPKTNEWKGIKIFMKIFESSS